MESQVVAAFRQDLAKYAEEAMEKAMELKDLHNKIAGFFVPYKL